MPIIADELIAEIHAAFNGVTLGEGIGLWEAQAIDDYGDADDRRKARERDEKNNLAAISLDVLGYCESSLCFFDADGMRFHLPAFLIADILEKYYADGALYSLISSSGYMTKKFSTLSTDQRRCVNGYLEWRLLREECDFERNEIERSLLEDWIIKDNK